MNNLGGARTCSTVWPMMPLSQSPTQPKKVFQAPFLTSSLGTRQRALSSALWGALLPCATRRMGLLLSKPHTVGVMSHVHAVTRPRSGQLQWYCWFWDEASLWQGASDRNCQEMALSPRSKTMAWQEGRYGLIGARESLGLSQFASN